MMKSSNKSSLQTMPLKIDCDKADWMGDNLFKDENEFKLFLTFVNKYVVVKQKEVV